MPHETGVALARMTGGQLVTIRGGGHAPTMRDPVRMSLARSGISPSRWACGRGRRRRRRRRGPGPGPATEKRVLYPCRRSAWATYVATSPSPTSSARSTRRGDRVALAAPGHGLPGAGRRAGPSSLGLAGERERSYRVGVGRARSPRLPGDPPDGRDPGGELHGVRRPGTRARLRPLGRRRGVGPRPLPAREPGPQARAVRLDDRLRRLGADGRRRRPRGVPDLRLQRGDGRARRALPAAARPVGLRRRPRGPGRRPVGSRAPVHPRLDAGALRLHGLRHGRPTGSRRAATAPRTARLLRRGGRLPGQRRRLGRGRAVAGAHSTRTTPPRPGCRRCGSTW